jgi:hypothetical protein
MSTVDDGLAKKAYEDLLAEQANKVSTPAAEETTALPQPAAGELPRAPAAADAPDKQDRSG